VEGIAGMKLRTAAPLIALLLAGCGGEPAAEAGAGSTPIHAASIQCDALPGFAVLYADAVVTGCFKGPSRIGKNHESGTVIYVTRTAPAEVLTWYKEQASAKALADDLSTETMYSAREGTKRSIMVMTEAQGDGARVTLNWGRDL
jgi:hypothetical protein